MSPSVETLDQRVMKYCADCIEWCPAKEFQNIFACGTYQLNEAEKSEHSEKKASRLGCVSLFKVNKEGLMELITSVGTAGILDMKWGPKENFHQEPLLATANAEGEISLYSLQRKAPSQGELTLSCINTIKCVEKDGILCLSLAWCVNGNDVQIVVSDSIGNISILQMNNFKLERLHQWNAHSHEAWIATFDNENPNIVYSGGDDCHLVIYDSRERFQIASLKKQHESGVTSLSCNFDKNVLATGSYDEWLRLWDKRNWKTPIDQSGLGGGVWKTKWKPITEGISQNLVLAACMHGGFKVIDCSESWKGGSMSEYIKYSEHDSLAYGCDWCYSEDIKNNVLMKKDLNNSEFTGLIATCSFYDRKLSLWLLH